MLRYWVRISVFLLPLLITVVFQNCAKYEGLGGTGTKLSSESESNFDPLPNSALNGSALVDLQQLDGTWATVCTKVSDSYSKKDTLTKSDSLIDFSTFYYRNGPKGEMECEILAHVVSQASDKFILTPENASRLQVRIEAESLNTELNLIRTQSPEDYYLSLNPPCVLADTKELDPQCAQKNQYAAPLAIEFQSSDVLSYSGQLYFRESNLATGYDDLVRAGKISARDTMALLKGTWQACSLSPGYGSVSSVVTIDSSQKLIYLKSFFYRSSDCSGPSSNQIMTNHYTVISKSASNTSDYEMIKTEFSSFVSEIIPARSGLSVNLEHCTGRVEKLGPSGGTFNCTKKNTYNLFPTLYLTENGVYFFGKEYVR